MPTRTIVQDLCDVCFEEQEKEVPATDRLRFAWQGRNFVLLVCELHVDPIRNELQRLSELATPEGSRSRASGAARQTRTDEGDGAAKTLFSQLTDEEKQRFRLWADLPNARRIANARVQEWSDAGKP